MQFIQVAVRSDCEADKKSFVNNIAIVLYRSLLGPTGSMRTDYWNRLARSLTRACALDGCEFP